MLSLPAVLTRGSLGVGLHAGYWPSRSRSARICALFDIAAALARGAGLRGGEAFGGLGSASWHEVYKVDINDTPIESITPSGIKTSDCEFGCMTSAISDAVPILAAP